MAAQLVVNAGPDKGKVFALADDKKSMIGRGESATIQLTDLSISRAHCVIEYYNGKAFLVDNGSKTGTRVNGAAITRHELNADEVINIGTTKLRFQVVTTQQAPATGKGPEDATHPELVKLSRTTLGHFALGPVVGIGGSGVVFRARNLKEDREVALKVYTPAFAEDEVALQRFIRAVKTMLPLRHKNLVTLYDGGKTGPYCWMSMEYVEGENLKQTIARIGTKGNLEWHTALRMATDIASGLYYLHGESIIHRSLSPGNLLLSRLGTVKLASLILAKALSGDLAHDVTVGNELLGDIRFLAPEQIASGSAVDARADIFSLGTLLYTLLVGKTPFEGKSTRETTTAIMQREPDSPCKLNPRIPLAVEDLVLKMLAKKPADRFQNAGELIAELEQLPRS